MTQGRHAFAAGLIGVVVSLPALLAPIDLYDGGLAASAATFVLHGALPNRDFWWLYGPLGPALIGAVTFVVGPSLLALRLMGLAISFSLSAIGYLWMRRHVSFVVAVVVPGSAVVLASFLFSSQPNTWFIALALALAGLYVRATAPRRGILAAALIGAAFLVRLDIGGYALLAALLAPDRRAFALTFALIAIAVAVVAVVLVPLSDLLGQLVLYPLVGPRQFRGLPLPTITDETTLAVFVGTIVVPKLGIALALARMTLERWRPPGLAVLTLFAALCQLQTTGRADIYHQVQGGLPGILLFGWVLGAIIADEAEPDPASMTLHWAAVAALGLTSVFNLLFVGVGLRTAEIGPLRGDEEAFVAGVRTIRANTTRDEPIFVGLTSHRITIANDMLAYFLADRRAGVRVAMFNPGVTNTDEVQRGMVNNLQSSNTRILLLDDRWALDSEPSNDSRFLGSMILDDYIRSRYTEACNFGSIHILVANGDIRAVDCVPPRAERLIDILGPIDGS